MKEQNEKQAIEEMAKVVCNDTRCKTCIHHVEVEDCAATKTEKRLYNAGYRKQSAGVWIFNRGRCYGEPAYYCSNCSEGASEYGMDNFCPSCGARMKGGAE
jgi:hypothetical protein